MTASSSADIPRARRLFTILQMVAARRDNKRIGRAELARACACCKKTITRDIELLQIGLPLIDYDPVERTYYLPDKQQSFSLFTMTPTDALALALVRSLVASCPALPFADWVDAVLDKAIVGLSPALRLMMEHAAAGIVVTGRMARDYSHAPLEVLLNGIARHRTVEMLYDSQSSGLRWRTIDPYRIDEQDGQYLFLQAWCEEHKEVRTFAVNYIKEAKLTDTVFTPRSWDESNEGVVRGLRGKNIVSVEVWFSSEVMRYAQARLWPFMATFEEADNGGIIMRGEVKGTTGMVRELLSWRRHAKVLGGPELKSAMEEEIAEMAALYQSP